MRTETLYKGGYTGGLKVAHLAESFGMRAEVHGGGIANLHLCLAIPNNTYYEDIVIDPANVRGKKNDRTLNFNKGVVSIPEGTVGIGFNLDVKDIGKRSVQTMEVS
jgi:L-alanine-DL-glutamate epimerase-like enolase superfamily enzyme